MGAPSVTDAVAGPAQPSWSPLRRLPLALAATGVVALLPAVVVARLVPTPGALALVGALCLVAATSWLLARAGEALWLRHPGSTDVLFADLMLWGWARRTRTERRLRDAQRLLGPSRGADRAQVLQRLSQALEARDAPTLGHSRRVARHAEAIAHALRLPAEEIARIRTAAAVHDIGKIHVPRAILTKTGPLTGAEYAIVTRHAADGAQLVAALGDPAVTAMVRHHHERLDGGGYPDGLAGPAIPLGARVIAVADTFDAMTSDRTYRAALRHKRAVDVLRAESGHQLDADVVGAFLAYYRGRSVIAIAAAALAALPARVVDAAGRTAQSVAGAAPAAGAAALTLAVAPAALSLPESAPVPAARSVAAVRAVAAAAPQRGAERTVVPAAAPQAPALARAMRRAPAPGRAPAPRIEARHRRAGVAPPPHRRRRGAPAASGAPVPSGPMTATAATQPPATPAPTPAARPAHKVPPTAAPAPAPAVTAPAPVAAIVAAVPATVALPATASEAAAAVVEGVGAAAPALAGALPLRRP